MIATAQNSAPCRVFDANGLEWKHMRWVDTETGEGEQCVLDDNGQKQLNAHRDAVLTQAVKLAAPVLIMPMYRARMSGVPCDGPVPTVEDFERHYSRKGGA